MKNIVKSLLRLISVRNIVAIVFAYVFEVKIAYLILNVIYGILYFFFVREGKSHWIITEHWLDATIWTLFLAQISVPFICQVKIELGVKNQTVQKWLNVGLNCLMWPMFAVMAAFFLPSLQFVKLLKKHEDKHPWFGFVIDTMYVFLTTIAVFNLGIRTKITGKFPKRESFLRQFWRALRGKSQVVMGMIINFGHEGMADYFIWPYVLGFMRARIIAGKNLLKYWVVGTFIYVKSIIVDRKSMISRGKCAVSARESINRGISVAASAYGGRKGEEEIEVIRDSNIWEDGLFVLAVETGQPVISVNVTQSGKYRPKLNTVLPEMPEDKWKQLEWLIKAARNVQWYCNFIDVYVDILEPIYPLPLVSTDKEELIREKKEKAQELKLRVYEDMKKHKLKRLALIEAESSGLSVIDRILRLCRSISDFVRRRK